MAIAMQQMSFTPIPIRNPKTEPIEATKAEAKSFLAINSPISAPKKGPYIIPRGKKNNPIIVPIAQPITPCLEHLSHLAPNEGINKSITVTIMVNVRAIRMLKVEGCVCSPISLAISNAQNAIGGPGSAGRIQPANPTIIKIQPMIIKVISIMFFLLS